MKTKPFGHKSLRSIAIISLLCILGLFLGFRYLNAPEPLPEASYPLSREALTEILQSAGLNWELGYTGENTQGEDVASSYVLNDPSIPAGKKNMAATITSFDTAQAGRRLQMYYELRKTPATGQAHPEWEDLSQCLQLAARLYGGFSREDAILKVCKKTAIPTESNELFLGEVEGRYITLESYQPLSHWARPDSSITLQLNIYSQKIER